MNGSFNPLFTLVHLLWAYGSRCLAVFSGRGGPENRPACSSPPQACAFPLLGAGCCSLTLGVAAQAA